MRCWRVAECTDHPANCPNRFRGISCLSGSMIWTDYRNRKKENPADRKGKCFFVPICEIKENGFDLSISRYKEIEYAEVHYEKPEVIIEKIEALEIEIQKGLKDLKALLK